jgi:hypothetical protein
VALSPDLSQIKLLEERFCSRCALINERRKGHCPKGQTTCGAQIRAPYILAQSYAGLPAGSIVTIKDIFWAVGQDYATVTISTAQNQRFGVACTMLAPQETKPPEQVSIGLPMQANFSWLVARGESERAALFEHGLELLLKDVAHGPRRRTLPGHDLLNMAKAEKLPIPLSERGLELFKKIKQLTQEDELLTAIRVAFILMRHGLHESDG